MPHIRTAMSLQRISTAIIFVLIFLASGNRANAQMPPQGYRSTSILVGGRTFSCTSGGMPVILMADYTLNDGGTTYPGVYTTIAYNPTVLMSMPGQLQLWAMGHECGHAYNRTSDENVADCWSITMGIKQGWFTPDDFDYLVQLFQHNPGDLSHPPGPARIANMKSCMDKAANKPSEAKPDDSQDTANSAFDSDPTASQCADRDGSIYDIDWHKTADDPTVHYRVGYENTCDKPVQCLVRVGVGNRPKGDSSYDDWDVSDQNKTRLTIPAQQSKAISGTLTWDVDRPAGTMPSLRFSDSGEDGDWTMVCKFAP